jgi:hypothetical protein
LKNILESIYEYKIKIIFLAISLLALHSFFLIFILGVDLPQSDELDFIPFVKTFFDGGLWWEDSEFLQHYTHRQTIPSFILLISSVLDNGNIVNMMYLAASFLIVVAITLYYLLRNTEPKLVWLTIPIAALVFNAGQYGCYLWGTCAISWFLTSMSIILMIFFISRIENNKFSIILAIIFSTVASFTIFHGLLAWIIGGFGLLFLQKRRKESLIIWSISTLTVYLVYFTNYTQSWKGVQYNTLFTVEGIEYVLLFLSNGLIVHLHELYPIQIAYGIAIVVIIIVGPIYLRTKKHLSYKIIPWVQIGLFGLMGGVITELGRFGVVGAVASRYIAIATFAQIACLVIGTIVFLYWYNKLENRYRKKIAKMVFIIFMIFLVIGISSSYYSGWKNGGDWLTQNIASYECLRDPMFDLKCKGIFSTEQQYNNLKILKELQLSVFSKEIKESVDPLLEDSNWKDMRLVEYGEGEIEYINNNPFGTEYYIPTETKIFVDKTESAIDVGGWGIFTKKDVNVNSAYVFIDEKVNSKSHLGYLNLNYGIYEGKTEPSFFAGIGGIINLQKISDGCHTISIRIVHGIDYHTINTDSQICIK